MRTGNKKITRVCAPANQHMLLQYLLISSEKDLSETFYFLDQDAMGKDVCSKFPDAVVSEYRNQSSVRKILFYVRFFFLRYLKYWRYPFLKNAVVFSSDHIFWGWFLTFDRPYHLLEDGYALYGETLYNVKDHVSAFRYLVQKIIFHPYPAGSWGQNPRCSMIHLSGTLPERSPLLKNTISTCSFRDLWNQASDEKKKLIMNIFDISQDDISFFDGAEALILTQPFSEDGFMSETEKIRVYRSLIEKYQLKNVVFKPHPRESTDYSKYFPEARCFQKKCPIELLALFDLNFHTVATLFSSAVMIFRNEGFHVIWAGTELFEREIDEYKNIKPIQ